MGRVSRSKGRENNANWSAVLLAIKALASNWTRIHQCVSRPKVATVGFPALRLHADPV